MAENKYDRQFKPRLLRPPFATFIFIYICILIALLEHTRRTLPVLRDRPPTPGEVVPAGTIPLTTAASFDDPDLRIPHPPSTQFEGIDVPAFRTANWGLSVWAIFTHGEPVTIPDITTYLPALGVEDGQADPYKMGRCVLPVFTVSFTNNPDDCNALVEDKFVSGRREYNIHLIRDDCYSSAIELEKYLWNKLNWQMGGGLIGLTITPECWSSEEQMMTVFTSTKNQYPGNTVMINPGWGFWNGIDEIAFVNASTQGGWPLNLNAGSDCWEIVSTPYLPFPHPDSLSVYNLGEMWHKTLPLPLWSEWEEQRIIRAYMTEEPLDVDLTLRLARPTHIGCWREAVTTSRAPLMPTSAPPQTVPIFSKASLPPTSTISARASESEPTLASQTASSLVKILPWVSTSSKFPGPSIATSSSPSPSTVWTVTSTTKPSREGILSGSEGQESTKTTHLIDFDSDNTGTTDKPGATRTTHRSSETTEAIISNGATWSGVSIDPTNGTGTEVKTGKEDQRPENSRISKTNDAAGDFRSVEAVPSLTASISPDKDLGAQTQTNLRGQQPGESVTSTIMPSFSTVTISKMQPLIDSYSSRQDFTLGTESASMPNESPSSNIQKARVTITTKTTEVSIAFSDPKSGSLAQIQTTTGPPVSFLPAIQPASIRDSVRPNGNIIAGPSVPTRNSRPVPPSTPGSPGIVKPAIRRMSGTEYLAGLLGPVVLCTILSVLIQVLCANLRAVMPFAILSGQKHSTSGGVSASDSVCLVLGGIKGPLTSLGLLWRLREPLPFLLDFLILLSTVVTSISTSTVSLGFFGFCEAGSHDGWCYMGLGYYSLTLKIAEGMLICMAVLLLPVGFLLVKLKTGVASPPWSVGYIASLSVSVNEPNIRGLWDVLREMKAPKDDGNIPSKQMVKHLERYNFTLGRYRCRDGSTKYGILAHEKHESNPHMPRLDESNEGEMYELEAVIAHDPVATEGEDTDTVSRYSCSTPSVASYNTGRTSQRRLLREGQTSSVRSSIDISCLHLPLEEDLLAAEPEATGTPTGLSSFNPVQLQEREGDRTDDESRPHPKPAGPREQTTERNIFLTEDHLSIRASIQTFETHSYSPSITSTTALIPPHHVTSTGSTIQPFAPTHPEVQVPIPPAAKETSLPRRNPKGADLHTIFQTTVLILLSALFILITYYESVEIDPLQPSNNKGSSSISISVSFEQFMDSQSIGVSILFTSLAVCITLFWDYIFSQSIVTTSSWWRFGSTLHLTSRDMMMFTPPITVFDGFVKSLPRLVLLLHRSKTTTDRGTLLPLMVSTLITLAGILSKGIPILMAHIPFRRYQTWGLHLATGWTTVGILGYMILVLGAYLVVVIVDGKNRGEQLPVRPDCIAGVVYYLTCDGGEVVRDFQQQQQGGQLENADNVVSRKKNEISTERQDQVEYVFGGGNSTNEGEHERRVGFRRVVF